MAAEDKEWSIQSLRFVAALLIVLHHAINVAMARTDAVGLSTVLDTDFGRCGVDIFFVISGFIITRTARGIPAGRFLQRRAIRILPLYWMVASLWTVWAGLKGTLTARALLATWLLWPATDRITAPLVPVAWTLCFEVLFYIAFSLTLWRRQMMWVVAGVFATALVLRSDPLLQFIGNPISLEFLAGVGLAFLPKWRPAVVTLPIGAAILLAGALLQWPPGSSDVAFINGNGAWYRLADMGLPSALVVWGALQLRAREGLFTYLGETSYALYLVHVPVIYCIVALLTRIGGLPIDLIVAAAATASVLLAWRIHELIERPTMAWLRRASSVRGAPRSSAIPAPIAPLSSGEP